MKTLENVVVLSLEDYEQLMKNQKTEELEVGKWYFVDRSEKIPNDNKALVMYQGQEVETYGFSHAGLYVNGYWCFNTFCNPKYTYSKASPIEVYEALKKHAISLGFDGDFSFNESMTNEFKFDGEVIFKDGIWEKPKPKIDYSRLKTGSVVKLKYNGSICDHNEVDFNSEFDVILFKSKNYITMSGKFGEKGASSEYCTFYQNGNFVLYSCDYGIDYITEVISY